MTMQNYAKFESRVAEDSFMQEQVANNYNSIGSISSSSNNFFRELFWFLEDLLDSIVELGAIIALTACAFYFLYLVFSLFKRGSLETLDEMKVLGK